MMDIDWQQIMGFVSLVVGFFWSLRNVLSMATESQKRLIGIIEQIKELKR